MNIKKYYLYDIYTRRVLINTQEKIISIYYDVAAIKTTDLLITAARIRGLQRRLQKVQTLENSYVYDIFIYTYMMNNEQRMKCKFKPDDYSLAKLIISSDSIEAISQALELKK